LCRRGVLLGLFFEVDGTLEEGPPFPTTRSDIIRHFEPVFEINRIEQPQDSFAKRQGREWLASMQRREVAFSQSMNSGGKIP
jgi:hypothetical protein